MTEEKVIYDAAQQNKNQLDSLRPIESHEIDFTQFEGTKKVIENLLIMDVPSQFHKEGHAKVLKVETEPITAVEIEKGNKDIRASELFNLTMDKNGELGWSESPKAALNRFLKKQNVTHPNQLIGCPITIRVRSKETNQGRKEFLGFIRD